MILVSKASMYLSLSYLKSQTARVRLVRVSARLGLVFYPKIKVLGWESIIIINHNYRLGITNL